MINRAGVSQPNCIVNPEPPISRCASRRTPVRLVLIRGGAWMDERPLRHPLAFVQSGLFSSKTVTHFSYRQFFALVLFLL
jgi:hypothetical protein